MRAKSIINYMAMLLFLSMGCKGLKEYNYSFPGVEEEEISCKRFGKESLPFLFPTDESLKVELSDSIKIFGVDVENFKDMYIDLHLKYPPIFEDGKVELKSVRIEGREIPPGKILTRDDASGNYKLGFKMGDFLSGEDAEDVVKDSVLDVFINIGYTFSSYKQISREDVGDTSMLKNLKDKFKEFIEEDFLSSYPVKDTFIKRVADSLKNSGNVLDLVRNAYDYTIERIEYYEEELYLSPNQSLKDGRGDCDDYSDAVITLCRAMGIPARSQLFGVVGTLDDSTGIFYFEGFHAWPEVLLPLKKGGYKWVYLEPTWGDGNEEKREKYFLPKDNYHAYIISSSIIVKSKDKHKIVEKQYWNIERL